MHDLVDHVVDLWQSKDQTAPLAEIVIPMANTSGKESRKAWLPSTPHWWDQLTVQIVRVTSGPWANLGYGTAIPLAYVATMTAPMPEGS